MTVIIPPALRGAQLLPVSPGEKACRKRDWPNLRLPLAEIEQHAANGGNVACRMGSTSGDLVDADLDCPEAIALASIYLPGTSAIFGRPSKPASHWLYRARGAIYANLADPTTGEMLAELRADGREGGGTQHSFRRV